MARAGRKRKQGARTKTGRLSRAGVPLYDKGTERVQAMQALYGPDGGDAIGRAYRSGLLGEGSEAKAMLDMARSISNAYWQAFETGAIRCTLGERTFGSVVLMDEAKAKRREEWLNYQLDTVKGMGEPIRKAFYQLAIDVNPDCGPPWLDRLCVVAQRIRKPSKPFRMSDIAEAADQFDLGSLGNAIKALEELTA